jgi:thiamine-phosphate pyrophosphorylase
MIKHLLRRLPARDYTLYFVADVEFASGRDLVPIIREAVRGGATVVQLRSKDLPFHDFLDLARRVGATLKTRRIPLVINDRVDVAMACRAAGVHLGQEDMPLSLARKMLARNTLIGCSVNSTGEALEAESQGADYVGLGPVFPTMTKSTGLPVLGLAGLREVKSRVRIPVIAIGGITPQNARSVREAGADGVAVVSSILGAEDPGRAARALKRAFCS